MNRTEKDAAIQSMHERFAASGGAILVDMTGMQVNEVTELRRRIKGASGRCRVVKNRLAARAAMGTTSEALAKSFKGPLGIVTYQSDMLALAKVLEEFAKDHPKLEVRAAAVDGALATPAQVKALAALPGMPQLRAQLLGLLQTPATTLVRLLNTPGAQLARALEEHRKKIEASAS